MWRPELLPEPKRWCRPGRTGGDPRAGHPCPRRLASSRGLCRERTCKCYEIIYWHYFWEPSCGHNHLCKWCSKRIWKCYVTIKTLYLLQLALLNLITYNVMNQLMWSNWFRLKYLFFPNFCIQLICLFLLIGNCYQFISVLKRCHLSTSTVFKS